MKKHLLILFTAMFSGIAFSQSIYHNQDNLNRIDSIVYPDSSWTKIVYDKSGNIISENNFSICDKYLNPVVTGTNHFCKNDSTTLTSTLAAKYLWSTGDSTRSIKVRNGGSYKVKITYANECEKESAPFVVTVDSLPVVTISGPDSACNSVTLVASGSTGIYTWNGGSSPFSRTNTFTLAGTYTVNVKGVNGCVANASKTIAVFLPPSVTITGTTTACDSVTLTASVGFFNYNASYSWNGGLYPNSATNTFTQSGSYAVTVTTAQGCSTTVSQSVSIKAKPIVTISGSTTGCSSVTLTANGGVSYSWNGGNNPNSATNTFTSSGTYIVTVTGANGCTATKSVSITVNSIPVASISGATTGCGSVTLTASGGVTYLWNGGTTPNAATNTFTTSGTYSVRVTNASGCSTNMSKSVTVNPLPVATVIGSTTGCGSVILTANGGISYLWDGGTAPTSARDSFLTSGIYSVRVTGANGCTTSISKTVTVNTQPIPTITGPSTACGSITLTASGGTSYSWNGGSSPNTASNTFTISGTYSVRVSIGSCSVNISKSVTVNRIPTIAITGATSGCTNVTLTASGGVTYLWNGGSTPNTAVNTFTSSGTYTVTVTDVNGCSATMSKIVTVNLPPIVSIVGTTTGCGNVTLTATGGSSYVWSGGSSSNTAVNFFTTSGTYTVTATGVNGCTARSTATVVVNPKPIIIITGEPVGCDSVTLTASGGTSYLWNGGRSLSPTTNVFTTSGVYTVSTTATNGCTDNKSISVIVNPTPSPILSVTNTCIGNNPVLSLDSNANITQIQWLLNDSIISTINSTFATNGITVAGGNGTGSAANQFNYPEYLSTDIFGNLYVSDRFNNRIQKWLPGATSGITVAGGNGVGDSSNQFNTPIGLFVDGGTNIYVADYINHRIQKWTPGAINGVTIAGGNGVGSAPNQLLNPIGVYVDKIGNVYIADQSNNRVQKWAPGATAGITVAGGNGRGSAANQFNYLMSIWVDSSANVYVSEYINSRVQKWVPGATSGVTVAGGNGIGSAANQLDHPMSVFVDKSGNVFVGDMFNNRIQKWAPGATSGVTVVSGNVLGNPNHLTAPEGVYIDQNGDLFIADQGNRRVVKFSQIINRTFIPTIPGTYKAIVTINGCTSISNSIRISPSPTITITQNNGLQLCATPRLTNYVWNTGATSSCINITASGTYSVSATDRSGCVGTATINVTNTNCIPLAGNYKIGGTGANFNTIKDATNALFVCGVNQPVVFDIRSGNYYGSFNFPDTIPGSSSINTISFKSEKNSADSVRIYSDTLLSYHVQMKNTKYVSFTSIRFEFANETPNYNYVNLVNTSNIYFKGCKFNATQRLTNNLRNIKISNSKYCGFSDNVITSINPPINFICDTCYYATVYGNAFQSTNFTGLSKTNTISGNSISLLNINGKAESYGITNNNLQQFNVSNLKYSLIENNKINTRSLCQNCINDTISKNSVTGILIVINSDSMQIVNNMVLGQLYSNANKTNIYQNTIYTPSGYLSPDSSTVNITGTNVNCVNNIFKSSATSYPCAILGNTITSDYNIYAKTVVGNLINKAGINYPDLSTYQNNTSQDLHSLIDSVRFVSSSDLHIVPNGITDNAGRPVGIYDDMDNDVRDSLMPDIGADEFKAIAFKIAPATIAKDSIEVLTNCDDELTIFPNPATNELTLIYNNKIDGKIEYLIITSDQQIMSRGKISDNAPIKIKIGTYAKGTYFISILTDKNLTTCKFIKE